MSRSEGLRSFVAHRPEGPGKRYNNDAGLGQMLLTAFLNTNQLSPVASAKDRRMRSAHYNL